MGRTSGKSEIQRWMGSLLRFDRLSWWLVVLGVLALLGQEIVRTSGFVVAASAEFEGFGDELEEIEDELGEPFVVPPPVLKEPGFQNDRGPPSEVEEEDVQEDLRSETTTPAVKESEVKRTQQDFWDEDEFEGLPVEIQDEPVVVSTKGSSAGGGSKQSTSATPAAKKPAAPKGPQSYYVEAIAITFLIAYIVLYFVGRQHNEKLALAWAAQYASKDSVFDKNFSLLGTGDGVDSPLLMKEGQNVFKFYASGRRYCEGMLATMDFQSRHDLITSIWYLIAPRKDEMTIDVYMNEEAMDPIVFAITRRKHAKTMHKEKPDLLQYASILNPSSNRKWLSEELLAISESRELATDLMTDALLEQVFGEKAFEKFASHFISLHFTDQNPGVHKKILQFKFTIPPQDKMAEMSRLISTVTYFIDAVGRYKLSPQARAKADAARAKVAQEAFKENAGARQEALVRKKEEKRRLLEEAEAAKLSPEVLRKREEKERARQLKKSMPKIKMTRAH